MSLSIQGVSKTYDKKIKAFSDVNLNIGKEVFGLLGPNGSGKTSLLGPNGSGKTSLLWVPTVQVRHPSWVPTVQVRACDIPHENHCHFTGNRQEPQNL